MRILNCPQCNQPAITSDVEQICDSYIDQIDMHFICPHCLTQLVLSVQGMWDEDEDEYLGESWLTISRNSRKYLNRGV